jgi:hypothetical protein
MCIVCASSAAAEVAGAGSGLQDSKGVEGDLQALSVGKEVEHMPASLAFSVNIFLCALHVRWCISSSSSSSDGQEAEHIPAEQRFLEVFICIVCAFVHHQQQRSAIKIEDG